MDRQEIEQKVKEIVAYQFGIKVDELFLDTSFVKDLNTDSLDLIEMVMGVEDRFDITVPDEEAEKLMTIGAVVDYLENRFANDSSK